MAGKESGSGLSRRTADRVQTARDRAASDRVWGLCVPVSLETTRQQKGLEQGVHQGSTRGAWVTLAELHFLSESVKRAQPEHLPPNLDACYQVRRGYTLCDSSSVTFRKSPVSGDGKKIRACQGLGGEE